MFRDVKLHILHTFNYSYCISKIHFFFFDSFLFTISYIKIQLLVISMNVILHKKWLRVEIDHYVSLSLHLCIIIMVTAYIWYVHVLASAEINISFICILDLISIKKINCYNLKSAFETEKQEFVEIKFPFPSNPSNVVHLFT